MPSSSLKRSPSKPIESVTLTVKFRADKETSRKVTGKIPAAVMRSWGCEFSIDGDSTKEVADKAQKVMDAVREIVANEKRL